MSINVALILLNIAYLVYTASAAFKDILRLRVVLLIATFLYIAYGLVDPNWSVFLWNLPVAVLHMWAIWQLLSERRGIDLDDEAEAIRTLIFPDLDRVSFNTLWHCSEHRTVGDVVLIEKGHEVRELILILDGEVDVEVSDDLIVRLSQYRLVGEMSSLSGEVASATVTTNGIVSMRVWDKEALAACGKKHPEIQVALLKAMGQEVARKLS